jgi:hypothetical protein
VRAGCFLRGIQATDIVTGNDTGEGGGKDPLHGEMVLAQMFPDLPPHGGGRLMRRNECKLLEPIIKLEFL